MVQDLKSALIDQLRGGQTRSLVELVVDLGVPYDELVPQIEDLTKQHLLATGNDDGQVVYSLETGALENGSEQPGKPALL